MHPTKAYLYPSQVKSYFQNADFLGDFELAYEALAKLLGSRLGSVLRFSGVNTPLFWISTACSGPEGPAASQETENKGIDVFSTERGDTGG